MVDRDFAADLAGLVRARRSIRAFDPAPIDPSEIREILELAARAPSAWNLQPWRFTAVIDPTTKGELQAAAHGQPQVGSAPVVIVLASDMVDALARLDEVLPPGAPGEARAKLRANIVGFFDKLTPDRRDQWGLAQANIALGYLLILLGSRGYGSSPMLGFDADQVRSILDLPGHAQIAALVAFGRPAAPGRPSTRHAADSLIRIV